MKKLIIAALLIVGVSSFAQDNNDRPRRANMENMTPEQRSEQRVTRMTKELNLDAKQQEQLKQLYAEQAAERANAKDKKGQGRENMEAQRKAMEDKMKAILTPEQLTKWKASQDKMRERMQQRMGERQGGGMGDGPQGGGNMEN